MLLGATRKTVREGASHKSQRALGIIPKARARRPQAGIYGVPVMRNADRFDLADLDLSTIDLPANGERSLRDSVVPALALRLRSGGSRTWIVLRTKGGKDRP